MQSNVGLHAQALQASMPAKTGQVCRAERLRGPDAPLAVPERVAVKRVKPTMHGLNREMIEHEASVLRALAGKPFITPLYHVHLPPAGIEDDYGYLVMG